MLEKYTKYKIKNGRLYEAAPDVRIRVFNTVPNIKGDKI